MGIHKVYAHISGHISAGVCSVQPFLTRRKHSFNIDSAEENLGSD